MPLSDVKPDHDAYAWTGRFSCVEEVDAYLGGPTVHCLLCWRVGLLSLRAHLTRWHGVSVADYKRRFGLPNRRSMTPAAWRKICAERMSLRLNDKFEEAVRKRRPVDWEAFIRRLAQGEKQGSLLGRPGMPTFAQAFYRRRTDSVFDLRVRTALEGRPGARPTDETKGRVIEGLRQGRTLKEMRDDLPSRNMIKTLGEHRARDPVFASRVKNLWGIRRRSTRIAMPSRGFLGRFLPQQGNKASLNTALRSDQVYAAVYAVAQRLPVEIRDDVISDLVVALLDGEITITDLPKEVGRYKTDHNRRFGLWTPSLDADLGGGFTLGNSLVAAYV